jgi:hypothetical protein
MPKREYVLNAGTHPAQGSLLPDTSSAEAAPLEPGTEPSGKRKRSKKYKLKKILNAFQVSQLQNLMAMTIDDFEEVKPKKTRAEDAPKAPANMSAFFAFWQLYPRHDNQGAAMKAWRDAQLTPEDVEQILKDVQRRTIGTEWQKENGKYIPFPHTYLFGKRWLDEGIVHQGIVRRTVI